MITIYHYPPELISLLIDTIPLLNRSKQDVLLFFRGAGVSESLLNDISIKVYNNKDSISKYEITRIMVTRINEQNNDMFLKIRRELLKRIVEFDSYESCWDNDRIKAKGYVAEIRQVIKVKDAFSRMEREKNELARKHKQTYLEQVEKVNNRKRELEKIKLEISELVKLNDPHKRGKLFENVLNNLFNYHDILVKESFSINGEENEGIIEQIDGVIKIDSDYYLVEMKWWGKPVGKNEISNHLMGVFLRGQARGIYISVSGFTEPAITTTKGALAKAVVVLCDLYEIVSCLENENDFVEFLRTKIQSAIVEKNPYYKTT
ncbi:restriction endonuclease [Paenibacillus sp. YIM B09110]|uniref:restriction endonuclease n=1 Tax=Paenibacillus sp. YIM B09110 TaxID=3126102 RepID=UPI00301BA4FA